MSLSNHNAAYADIKRDTMWKYPAGAILSPISCVNGIFKLEVFIDLPNIERSLRKLKRFNTDYGELIKFVDQIVVERLGIKISNGDGSSAISEKETIPDEFLELYQTVWCFTSIPVNHHYEDSSLVRKQRGFLTALRRRHDFHVEEIPRDVRGQRIHPSDRTKDNKYPDQKYPEKGVDATLAAHLVQRCMSRYRPDAVVLLSGDADYGPVLNKITHWDPPIQVMVAAFFNDMSGIYKSGSMLGYSWQWPPIILDKFLDKSKVKRQSSSSN